MTSSRLQSGHDLQLLSNPSLWLCAVAAAFTMATTAHAANSPDDVQPPANAESMTPKQAYDHDKAYCNSQQATEQRSLCLKEAARAYQEARAGKLEPTTTASADDTTAPKHHRSHRMAKRASKNAETSTSGTSSSQSGSQDNNNSNSGSTGK